MYRRSNILLICISVCATFEIPVASGGESSNTIVKPEPVEVWFCWDPSIDPHPESESQYVHINRGVDLFVKVTQHFSPRDFLVVYDTVENCRRRISTLTKTCRTHGSTIMCDMNTMARATRMGGWMSALTFAYPGPKRIGEVPAPLARFLADAEGKHVDNASLYPFRRLSDVDWNVENVQLAIDFLDAWRIMAGGNELPDDYFPEFLPVIRMANAIAEGTRNYVYAYIFGHEIFHIDNTCPIPDALPDSVTEALDHLADVQIKAEALCFNPPSPREIEADRCALNYVHHFYELHRAQEIPNHDFAKRYTVDVLSQLILGRLSASSGTPTIRLPDDVRMKHHNTPHGYLFTPIRVIAVAELIRTISESKNWEVGLCDTAALDTFHALTGAAYCPEEREFEYASASWLNAFEDYFPARTMGAMFRDPPPIMQYWDDFACGDDDIRPDSRGN